jgi:hypothetical protein
LRLWRSAEDVNGWIGAHFEYDTARAMQLSETERNKGDGIAIYAPDAFFAAPAASASTSRASGSRRCGRSRRSRTRRT